MRKSTPFVALLLLTFAAPGAVTAQTLTGSITARVTDAQGGALPGATVTLSGKTGSKTATTGIDGSFRFVAVDPGTYDLRAEMANFRPARRQNLVITIGRTLDIEFTLTVADRAETLDVVAEAPVVDVTSSATDNQLSQDLLFNLPIRPFNAATQLLNYTPGVNNGSAFGGDADTANALMLDGVDTRDPEGGSAWTFFNFNIVEEVEVRGLGAPAEYGAFTGAVVNSITRSGGNRVAGLFDAVYSNDSLSSSNVTTAISDENAALKDPAKITDLLDFTAQMSGPLIKDKLFVFASAQRFSLKTDPTGPVTIRDEVSPRFNAKITWQPNPNDLFSGTFQADDYNIIGRPGVSALLATDELTNEEDSPERIWGVQWRHLFGSRTFSEVKYTGWTGYFDLNPKIVQPGHLDGATGEYSVSQGWFAYFDRGRHQANASISHFAEGFGKHDLKFGVEIERSRVRNRYGYVNDIFFYDYDGAPYLAYNYGYDLQGHNHRESLYIQDAWKVNDRLTVNPGLRFDWIRGISPVLDQKLYDVKSFAPRLGFALDLTSDNKTVLKGSYSQYYEGAFFTAYSGAVPGIEDFVLFDVTGASPVEIDRSPARTYRIDPDIKHPRVDEITIGIERALRHDVRLSLTGVWREDKNLQGSVIPSARWTPTTLANGLTNGSLTAYRWANRSASETDLLITNPDGFVYRDPSGASLGAARLGRKYKSLVAVLDKRFSNRWLGRISYVVSKAEGSVNNTGFQTFGARTFFESPSVALNNTEGRLTNDRTHELKVLATYQVPVVDVGVNAYYRFLTGRPYTPFQQFSSTQINFPLSSGRRVFLEPRGSRRRENESIVDLRLQKIFRVGADRKDRIEVYTDITNLFNKTVITGVIDRYPDQSIAGVGPVDFGAPAGLIAPRQVQIGARWSF